MKNLPLGVQTFKEVISGNHIYADKTKYIYNLLNRTKYNFLSHPRRFGKSLLLDTIAEVFGGDRELFRGLWIYDSDYEFEKHPVIRLDMSAIATETPEILKKSLASSLKKRISDEALAIDDEIPSDMFKHLIEGLCEKYQKRVVVLIDEYDKPILDHLDNTELAEANRRVIRGFYGILKPMDQYLRFSFVTGVSKFTKTSIFSELNNLNDITMSEDYANICGIPVESLDECFGEHIRALSEHKNFKQYDSLGDEILSWYDGYSWDGESRVINPFSLICFFQQKRFGSFWYASGTPKFLVGMIKKKPESYLALNNLKLTERLLDSFEMEKMEIEPLLFQTGYLTVKEVLPTRGSPVYLLDIPNFEVRDAFSMQVLSALTEGGDTKTEQTQIEIKEALEAGDLQKMLDLLRALFASIPYNLHVELEAYYHSIFYVAMTLLGFDMGLEVSSSRGKIDAALELGDKVYVMEFKYEKCPLDESPENKKLLFEKALGEAMAQIKNKKYSERYKGRGKAIYHAAFAFLGRDDIEMQFDKI